MVVVAVAARRLQRLTEVGQQFGPAALHGLGVVPYRVDPTAQHGLAPESGRLDLITHVGRALERAEDAAPTASVCRRERAANSRGIRRLRSSYTSTARAGSRSRPARPISW